MNEKQIFAHNKNDVRLITQYYHIRAINLQTKILKENSKL